MKRITSEAQLIQALMGLLQRDGNIRLVFQGQRHTKEIGISNKNVIYASSNLLKDKLSEILFKAGKLTRDQYMLSTELSIFTKKRMGEILIQEGFVSKGEVVQALNYQAKKIIGTLFEHPDWNVNASEWDCDDSFKITPQLPLVDAVVAGVRSVDNLTVLYENLPRKEEPLQICSDREAFMQRIQFTRDESLLLHLIDGKKTLQHVLDESRMLEYGFYKALYPLRALGLLRVERIPSEIRVSEKSAVAVASPSPAEIPKSAPPKESDLPDAQSMLEEAKFLISTEQYSKAANRLKNLILLNNKKSIYYYYLGLALDHIPGQNKEAEKVLKIAIRLENYNPRYYLALGYLYLNRNRPRQARQQFLTASKWDPTDPYVQEALVNLEKQGKKKGSFLTKKLF